ncbi:MAG TPA: hypothetical protein VE223_01955 [Nitrososphaeraceae archaeon]|nr:hypothetical protein [Nitrososphaeraceae archaeon]
MDAVQVMKLITTSYMTLGIQVKPKAWIEKNKDKVTTAEVTSRLA